MMADDDVDEGWRGGGGGGERFLLPKQLPQAQSRKIVEFERSTTLMHQCNPELWLQESELIISRFSTHLVN